MTDFKIEVGGKDFAFNIGVIFLGIYLQEKDTDLDTLFQNVVKNPFYYLPDLMYESAKYKTPKLKTTRADFLSLIDKEGLQAGAINEFLTKFTQSLTQNVPSEDVEYTKDAKKK